MFLAGTPLAALLLLSFIFITPFSPRWLATKGRDAEARKVLMTLRGGDEAAVEAELADIVATVEASRGSSQWASLMQPWVLRAVGVGVGLAFVQQWSGVNTVNSYAPDVLRKAGFDASDSLTQSIYIVRVCLGAAGSARVRGGRSVDRLLVAGVNGSVRVFVRWCRPPGAITSQGALCASVPSPPRSLALALHVTAYAGRC